MLHHLIRDKLSALVVDYLMYHDRDTPIRFDGKLLRLDTGIKRFELALPVVPHGSLPEHAAALPTVGPIDVGMHLRQHEVDLSAVKRRIHSPQQFNFDRRCLDFRHTQKIILQSDAPYCLWLLDVRGCTAMHPPPRRGRDGPNPEQRNQTCEPVQPDQLSKIERSILPA